MEVSAVKCLQIIFAMIKLLNKQTNKKPVNQNFPSKLPAFISYSPAAAAFFILAANCPSDL